MGKVKRLELWWQLYLYVTSGSKKKKKPAITLCAFECTTRDGQNNGKTTKYKHKTVCVGCTGRTLVVSIFRYSFVCLQCVTPVSFHCRLCLATVRVKVLQNGRLLRFSKWAVCWCAFSWIISNQNGHFIKCIQSSSSQGYDSTHKSCEDIISWEEQWPKPKSKWKGLPSNEVHYF
jgi:hypothetical protein